jgi:D-alanine-D-alanine ligase
MKKNKVALVFGGQSSEHEPTRKSFAFMLERLKSAGLRKDLEIAIVVYITEDGKAVVTEYSKKLEATDYEDTTRAVALIDAIKRIKDEGLFLFAIFYGQYGEDGVAQGMSEFFSIPSNLGTVLSCALGMSKYHLNQYVHGTYSTVKVPNTVSLRTTQGIAEKLQPFMNKEIVVKPSSLGSSVLTEKFSLTTETLPAVKKIVKQILELDKRALIQEYIKGTEYSCGFLEKDGKVIALPAVRIETKGNFFGQKEKFIQGYSTEIIVPEKEDTPQLKIAKQFAKEVYLDLEYCNATRFDFIVRGKSVYFLEINPLPGLLRNSILPRMLRTKGWDVENLIEIAFDNAQRRKKTATSFYFKVDG